MTDYPIKVKIESGSARQGKAEVVRLLQDIKNESQKTNERLAQIGPSASRSFNKASESALNLKKAIATIFTFETTRRAIQMLDTYTNIQNRLRLVTSGTENLKDVTKALFEIANQTRSAYEGTANLYSRLALATKDYTISQKELTTFTKSVNEAIIISGASAIEAENGLIQFSQGLASGALRGDELRAILEQLPAVADVIAKELGVTRGELRDLGAEGQITTAKIINAFKNAKEELGDRFGTTVPTVSQAFIVLRNNALQAMAAFNESTGITNGLAQALLTVAQNMNTVGLVLAALTGGWVAYRVAVLTAIALPIAAVVLGNVVAFLQLAAGVRSVTQATTLLTMVMNINPFILLGTALAGLIVYAGSLNNAWQYLKIGTANLAGVFLKFLNVIGAVANGIYTTFAEALKYAYNLLYQFGVGLNNFVNNPFGSNNFSGLKDAWNKNFTDVFKKGFDETMNIIRVNGKTIDEATLAIIEKSIGSMDKVKESTSTITDFPSILPDGIPGTISGSSKSSGGSKKSKGDKTELDDMLKMRADLLNEIQAPLAEYNNQLAILNSLEGEISSRDYTQAFDKIRSTYLNSVIPENFAEGFKNQLEVMKIETRNTTGQLGQEFGKIFGPGGSLTKGIGDAVGQSIVFGKSFKDQVGDISRTILSQLISAMVQVGTTMLVNHVLGETLRSQRIVGAAVEGAATTAAMAPAAAATSLATAGTNSIGATIGIGLVGAAIGALLATGFEKGGYTGSAGTKSVAGVVHGQEFVVNAAATRRNRGALEAMNSGQSIQSSQGININIINQAPGVEHSVTQSDNGQIEIIARRVVRQEAPDIIASDISNPNGKVSKSLSQNTKTERRRA